MRMIFPRLAAAAGFVSLLAVAAPPARGCSICRCGDPTFNALGTDVYKEGAFRVSLDWERFDKEQGLLPGEDGRETVVENRFTTALSYTFGERAVAVARIPWSSRRTSEAGGGFGDTGTSRDLADP